MIRVGRILLAAAVALLTIVPVALAADPTTGSDRVLISIAGDVTVPAGERVDTVLVTDGVATIHGTVGTLVAVDGEAILEGATVESIWAVGSDVELGPGTVVTGDVRTLDATVQRVGDAQVLGDVTDLSGALVGISAVLAPVFVLAWIGVGLATMAAGLLLAGLASRQVRDTGRLITTEPVKTLAVGLVGVIGIPLLAILLLATVIGAPLGLGILFGLLPLLAFVGYVVVGVLIGEWVRSRVGQPRVRERPYAATIIGIAILQLLGLVPVLSIVTAIACLFGFGAVVLMAWRTLRTPTAPAPAAPQTAPTAA